MGKVENFFLIEGWKAGEKVYESKYYRTWLGCKRELNKLRRERKDIVYTMVNYERYSFTR